MENAPESCLDIAEAVRTHRRTALETVDAALVQAERRQATFRAFITLAPELARRQAERVDQRVAAGERLPLAGVPFAIKDLFDAAGLPTTCGSKAFEDRIAERDATVVRRLVEAGAVLLGKANMHECAFGFTGENPHYGDCKNPVDPQRVAGGSSSGSAVAVALGICPFAIGSDTGGSIRLPAALCGLVGLKPTYGRVSRAGGVPLAWSMDHVGPLTRSAVDAAAVLQVIAGPDPMDDTASRRPTRDYRGELEQSIQGLRLGVSRDSWFFGSLDPAVASAVENAIGKLEALGAKRIEVSLPLLDEALGAHRAIIFAEASAYYRPFLRPDGPPFGDDIRPLLQAGLFLPAVDYPPRATSSPQDSRRLDPGLCRHRLPADADDAIAGCQVRPADGALAWRRTPAGPRLFGYDVALQPGRLSRRVGSLRSLADGPADRIAGGRPSLRRSDDSARGPAV